MRTRALCTLRSALLWLGPLVCCYAQIPATASSPERRTQSVPAKVLRFSRHYVAQFDRNGDGRLNSSEWSRSGDLFKRADNDGDGIVTRDELSAFLFDYGRTRHLQLAPLADASSNTEASDSGLTRAEIEEGDPSAEKSANSKPTTTRKYYTGARSAAAPVWFTGRDRDGDGQLTLAEFSAKGTGGQANDFRRLDRNHDGLITLGELSKSAKPSP